LNQAEKRKNRYNLIQIILGQGLSSFGSSLYLVSIISILTSRGPTAMGGFQIIAVIPIILLSPIAGLLIVKFNKKQVIIAADLFRGFLMLLMLLWNQESLLFLYGITLLVSVNMAIFQPAMAAIIPEIHSQPERAVSSRIASNLIANLVGSVFAITLLNQLGFRGILIINFLTFFLSAILELGIKPITSFEKQRLSVVISLKNGLRIFKSEFPNQLGIFIPLILLGALYGPIITAAPFLLKNQGLLEYFGLFYALLLAGGALGAVLQNTTLASYYPHSMLLSLSLFLLSLAGSLPNFMLAVLFFTGGLGAGGAQIYLTTSLYKRSSLIGGIFGLIESASQLAIPLSQSLGIFLLTVRAEKTDFFFLVYGIFSLLLIFTFKKKRLPEKSNKTIF
jgi:MFS family permease